MIGDGGDGGAGDAPFARPYDSFKHSVGVSLLSLGGVFAFADGDGMRFARGPLIVVLAFIGVAGVTSILMTGMLATLEVKPEPRAVIARRICIAQLIIGIALFGGLGGSRSTSCKRCSVSRKPPARTTMGDRTPC